MYAIHNRPRKDYLRESRYRTELENQVRNC
jgi:hypothetical protein